MHVLHVKECVLNIVIAFKYDFKVDVQLYFLELFEFLSLDFNPNSIFLEFKSAVSDSKFFKAMCFLNLKNLPSSVVANNFNYVTCNQKSNQVDFVTFFFKKYITI